MKNSDLPERHLMMIQFMRNRKTWIGLSLNLNKIWPFPMGKYLHPQADDSGKALLEFSKGKRLGDRGPFWLKIHGANCFGMDILSINIMRITAKKV